MAGLSVRVGNFSLRNLSFEIPGGAYGILMGRTGSGKTTLIEAICGLKPITAGKIQLGLRDVSRLKPAERGIGFVPQDGALFPTMMVGEQLAFPLEIRRVPKKERERRVGELAELLGISSLLPRRVEGLSGGEQQRIALGRALAASPKVLCLDEPLSALDESTRFEMYELLKSVQQHTGVTTLHITHSQEEAKELGDVVLYLHNGSVRELPPGKKAGEASDEDESGEEIDDPAVMENLDFL